MASRRISFDAYLPESTLQGFDNQVVLLMFRKSRNEFYENVRRAPHRLRRLKQKEGNEMKEQTLFMESSRSFDSLTAVCEPRMNCQH